MDLTLIDEEGMPLGQPRQALKCRLGGHTSLVERCLLASTCT
ncbi:hypothetical protein CaCOL14_004031 [Colletotrichum acutatum]